MRTILNTFYNLSGGAYVTIGLIKVHLTRFEPALVLNAKDNIVMNEEEWFQLTDQQLLIQKHFNGDRSVKINNMSHHEIIMSDYGISLKEKNGNHLLVNLNKNQFSILTSLKNIIDLKFICLRSKKKLVTEIITRMIDRTTETIREEQTTATSLLKKLINPRKDYCYPIREDQVLHLLFVQGEKHLISHEIIYNYFNDIFFEICNNLLQ